jgi:hypothetical protein
MAGEPYVLWDDHSTTRVGEIADPAGGWEPIGDDVTPVDTPPVGTKRWLEALAESCTWTKATARNARPGVVLIELAGEPRLGGVSYLMCAVLERCRVELEVTWTKTVDGPVW